MKPLRGVLWEQCWLYLFFRHVGVSECQRRSCSVLWLCLQRVGQSVQQRWEPGPRGHFRTEVAFIIGLSSLFPSAVKMPPYQQSLPSSKATVRVDPEILFHFIWNSFIDSWTPTVQSWDLKPPACGPIPAHEPTHLRPTIGCQYNAGVIKPFLLCPTLKKNLDNLHFKWLEVTPR